MDLVISADHKGLKKAIKDLSFKAPPKSGVRPTSGRIAWLLLLRPFRMRSIPRCEVSLTSADLSTARLLLKPTLDGYDGKAPQAMEVLESGFDDATAVWSFPKNIVPSSVPPIL